MRPARAPRATGASVGAERPGRGVPGSASTLNRTRSTGSSPVSRTPRAGSRRSSRRRSSSRPSAGRPTRQVSSSSVRPRPAGPRRGTRASSPGRRRGRAPVHEPRPAGRGGPRVVDDHPVRGLGGPVGAHAGAAGVEHQVGLDDRPVGEDDPVRVRPDDRAREARSSPRGRAPAAAPRCRARRTAGRAGARRPPRPAGARCASRPPRRAARPAARRPTPRTSGSSAARGRGRPRPRRPRRPPAGAPPPGRRDRDRGRRPATFVRTPGRRPSSRPNGGVRGGEPGGPASVRRAHAGPTVRRRLLPRRELFGSQRVLPRRAGQARSGSPRCAWSTADASVTTCAQRPRWLFTPSEGCAKVTVRGPAGGSWRLAPGSGAWGRATCTWTGPGARPPTGRPATSSARRTGGSCRTVSEGGPEDAEAAVPRRGAAFDDGPWPRTGSLRARRAAAPRRRPARARHRGRTRGPSPPTPASGWSRAATTSPTSSRCSATSPGWRAPRPAGSSTSAGPTWSAGSCTSRSASARSSPPGTTRCCRRRGRSRPRWPRAARSCSSRAS